MQSKNDIYRFATRNTLLITSYLFPLISIYFRPWRSWITQQIPILKNGGSNPFGWAKTKILSIIVGRIFVLYDSLFIIQYSSFIRQDFQ